MPATERTMMGKTVTVAFVIALAAGALPVSAANKTSFSMGSWSVVEGPDPMTDKLRCTAIYKKDWTVQADTKDFLVSYKGRGGIQGYQFRIDDDPAEDYQNATETERELSAAILPYAFERLYAGKRLRIRTSTLIRGVVIDDVDLSGFRQSIDYMRSHGC